MIWNIIASTSIGVACLLPFLFASPTASAFQFTYPPFDSATSVLSLARDSSFVPPYDVTGDEESRNERKSSGESDDRVGTTHFCFLVHGYQGRSGDLSYFETVLKHRAFVEGNHQNLKEKNQFETDDDFVLVSAITNKKDGQESDSPTTQDMVVHNCVCNEGKTNDGVIKGGDRLVDEIKETIHSNMERRARNEKDESNKLCDITLSMIGNSMGGLYARYAIAKFIERHCVAETPPTKGEEGICSWILDCKYRLRLDSFCTTAAPHLGVSEHTWIRIPRFAEMGVAATMGETGKDLFRLNNLLYTMSTDSTFLDPLACFRKRIAYANCYGTDFPVPVGTAAFLSEKSSYPHQFMSNSKIEQECDLVTATLMTSANEEKIDAKEPLDELHEMSLSLDRLGWKKIFIDLQKEVLSITVPSLVCDTESKSDNQPDDEIDLCGLKKSKKIVASKDIANVVYRKNGNDNRIVLHAPFGHNMIVAFSRDRLSTFLNKGGRPLVDALAKDLVQDVFARGGREVEKIPLL